MSRDGGSTPPASIRLAALAHGRPFLMKWHVIYYRLKRVECPELVEGQQKRLTDCNIRFGYLAFHEGLIMWYVYLLECSDGSFYVGHTDNLQERITRHNQGRGAKHTASKRPVELLWEEAHESKVSAIKREKQIKGWTKAKKKALAEGNIEVLHTLAKCKTASGRAFAKKRL